MTWLIVLLCALWFGMLIGESSWNIAVGVKNRIEDNKVRKEVARWKATGK